VLLSADFFFPFLTVEKRESLCGSSKSLTKRVPHFFRKNEEQKISLKEVIAAHQRWIYCVRLPFSFVEAALLQYPLLSLTFNAFKTLF
jgi:hypothetical protein